VIAASSRVAGIVGPGSALDVGPHAHSVTIAVANTATTSRTCEDGDRPSTSRL